MNGNRDDNPSAPTDDLAPGPATGAFDASVFALPALPPGMRLAERYRIARLLGQGAMGSVYEAIDEQRSGLRVALKLLTERQPSALYRLKNEFRALAATVHPNLVGLHGLGVDALGWFVVMDLLHPCSDFLSYVRGPARDTYDEGRLRAALVQLVRGVSAIHAAGKLHRDLKPRNVLVTGEGRVVIVDFGLVGDLERGGVGMTQEGLFAGTPAYAAPEQMLGEVLDPKADLYAIGVMLYEALTGRLPVEDRPAGRLLAQKLAAERAPASALAPAVAADLDRLCTALLQPEPGLRPDTWQILQQLGEQSQLPEAASALPFVARDAELRSLHELLTCAPGAPRVVVVRGPSGIGKTALVARFLERAEREAGALALRGRCHPQEQLPFKAFDTLLDELGHYLLRLPALEAASLMPRDIRLLSRLFPTLSRVPAVSSMPLGRDSETGGALLRSRAFIALKELLARIADRRALILTFDDLQWSDRDSAELLRELLRTPGAPPCTFVCVFREQQPGESAHAEELSALHGSLDLGLEPLDEHSSAELARSLVGDSWTRADLQGVVDEAAGSPFLLKELSRHARTSGRVRELRETVAVRITQLDAHARRLLELVCIAGQPLELGIALRASEVEPQALPAVLASSLVETRLQHGRECLQAQHERIREAIVASLDPERRAHLHRTLAQAFTQHIPPVPDLIARHYRASGEPQLAASYALAAAEQARHALAFGHAAELYELAIEHACAADKPKLEIELASVHASIGRLSDAAERYERVLDSSASAEQRRTLGNKAILLHLLLGNIERGRRLLDALCRELGIFPLPRRQWLAKLAITLLYLRYMLGPRVAALPVPSQSRHTQRSLQRVQLCVSAARGFAHWSYDYSSYFSLQAVLLIRRHRDPLHWPFAIACEVASNCIFHGVSSERDEREMASAVALAESQNDEEVLAMILVGEGARRIYTGQFSGAAEAFERSERVLAMRGRSVAPVSNGLRSGLYVLWVTTGRLDQVVARTDAWLAEAQTLGDRWGEQIAQLMGSYRFLALDRPEAMREAVADLIATAGREAPPFAALPAYRVEPALYLGRPEEALAAMLAYRREPAFRLLPRQPAIDRIGLAQQAIRACLAVALDDRQRRGACKRLVEDEVRRLRRERFACAPAVAAQARAGLASLRGDDGDALLELERAAQGFAAAGYLLYAAAARERIGKLRKGDRGAELVTEARSAGAALGLRNPERAFRALVTGFRD